MRTKTLPGILLFLMLSTAYSSAQIVKDSPVVIKNYAVTVSADQLSAITEINLELYNPNEKVLDGEYDFSLQYNQFVTGFYLDINGHFREGVIVEKQQARVAYENTIRRRIDPGLLEMTSGNNYRVRVYPVPAKGSRKIKIYISELLTAKENSLQYYLPVSLKNTVNVFSASINVRGAAAAPYITGGLLMNRKFSNAGNASFLHTQTENAEINQPLVFDIPLNKKEKQLFVSKTACSNLFALRVKPELNNAAVSQLNEVTVFWDISSSAAQRDIPKELRFLEQFVKQRSVKKITVVNFNTTVSTGKDFYLHNGFNDIKRHLMQQQFDGGTLLGSINCINYKATAFLLFSDGMNSFGNTLTLQKNKPVFCVNSSTTANHTALKSIADASGGAYADLSRNSVEEAVTETGAPKITLLAVSQGNKKINSGDPLFSPADWLTISGSLYDSTSDIVLELATWGIKTAELHIPVAGAAVISDTPVHLIQLQQQAKETAAGLLFAKQYKVVTPAASFIVLDNLSDYINYGIEPPAELQQEYQKNSELVKQQEAQKEYQKIYEVLNNLKKAVGLYNERIAWWGKPEAQISISNVEMQSALYAAAPVQNNAPANNRAAADFKGSAALDEVVVVGYGTQRRRELTGSVTTVSASQLLPGTVSVGQALQGKVAGVQVTPVNGAPGMADRILIRGNSSLSGREPLYIVNDMPVEPEYISTINTADIASITVFKDVQAMAIYGSRAAGGAIVITLKTPRNNYSYTKDGIARYKNMEDVDYVTELKQAAPSGLYAKYLELKEENSNDPSFFADAAQLLYANGEKEKAVAVLTNMAEFKTENHQVLRAMGYVFEEWGMYAYAVEVYKTVLSIKEEEPQSYRDLAMAYEKNGQHQDAVDLLYKVLTKNFNQYEDRYRGLKSLLLNELNGIIALHKTELDLSKINKAIIEPLPVDLRIVIDWNKDETDIDLHIIEPGGEECFYGHKQSGAGGRMSEDFTQGYGPEEYQIKQVQKGRYKIRVNYYGDRYQKQQVPAVLKLTIYKNFGRPGQTAVTETFIMNNQKGVIEIADVKF